MEHVDTTATVKNSNLFFLIQPNKNPDLTITEITEHAEILKLPIAPASLKAQRITSLTFAYNSDFPATVRVTITKILRASSIPIPTQMRWKEIGLRKCITRQYFSGS